MGELSVALTAAGDLPRSSQDSEDSAHRGLPAGRLPGRRPWGLPGAPGAGGGRRRTCGRAGAAARWPRRARRARTGAGSGCGAARVRPRQDAPPSRRLAEPPGREAFESERLEREDFMAAQTLGGPGDNASAALDELSRNFTYGAPGSGNGSLSGAWYRRNQVRAGRPAARWGQARGRGASRSSAALLPRLGKTRAFQVGRADLMFAHMDLINYPSFGRVGVPPDFLSWASVSGRGSHRSAGSFLGLLVANNPASPA